MNDHKLIAISNWLIAEDQVTSYSRILYEVILCLFTLQSKSENYPIDDLFMMILTSMMMYLDINLSIAHDQHST